MITKKQIRVLHVISSLDIKFGGPTNYIFQLVRKQIEIGLNSYILTTHEKKKNNDFSTLLKNKIYSFKSKNFRSLNYSRELKFFLDKNINEFDLIHIHGMYRFPTSYAAFLCRKQSIPYVIRTHGVFNPILVSRPSKNIFLKKLWEGLIDFPNLRSASLIQCSSFKEKKNFKKLNLNNKIFVSSNFINKLFQEKKNKFKNKKRNNLNINYPFLLFVGRINFIKGLNILIPAFSKFSNKNKEFRLVIIGPSNDNYLNDVIFPLIKKYNVSKKVFIYRSMSQSKLINYYKAAYMFVQPSLSESFGISIFEAMKCNLPVITTDQIDLARELKKNNAAQICKCNEKSLYNALQKVRSSFNLRKTLIHNGTKFIKNNLDQNILIKEMYVNYIRILNEKNAGFKIKNF